MYWRLGRSRSSTMSASTTVEAPEVPRNYLVVGSDVRSETDGDFGETTRSSAPTSSCSSASTRRRSRRTWSSLPRDLWVELPDGGHDRINAAYADGTPAGPHRHDPAELRHRRQPLRRGRHGRIRPHGRRHRRGQHVLRHAEMRDGLSGLDIPSIPAASCSTEHGAGLRPGPAPRVPHRVGRWRTDPTGDLGRISRQQVFVRRVTRAGHGQEPPQPGHAQQPHGASSSTASGSTPSWASERRCSTSPTNFRASTSPTCTR